MLTLLPAGRIRYGLGILAAPTSCGPAWGRSGNAQGTITVALNTEDASRQLVLVVNTYRLSGELEAAVRELQLAAFCSYVGDAAITDESESRIKTCTTSAESRYT